MVAATSCSFFPAICCLSSSSLTQVKAHQPILYPPKPNFVKPSVAAFKKSNPFSFSKTQVAPTCVVRVSAVSSLGNADPEAYPELEPSSSSSSSHVDSSPAEATAIDLKLPRRSLMVQFTCDSCGERTRRLINRLAYERGTVFVQCAECLQHHKLVDNLGIVVEYDLLEDVSMDATTDQVDK